MALGRKSYLKLLLASIGAAIFLTILSMFILSRLFEAGASRHRNDFYLFWARDMEQKIADLTTLEDIKAKAPEIFANQPYPRFGPPPGSSKPGEPPPPWEIGPPPPPPSRMTFGPIAGIRGFRRPPMPPGGPAEFWLVDAKGEIVYGNSSNPLPTEWENLPKPEKPYAVEGKQDFFRVTPGNYVVKLGHTVPLYLVINERGRPFLGPMATTQAAMTFSMVAAALLFSLSLTFFYLRRKSIEARVVLSRLEQGDLKARFEIARIDEFGELMLDFNRMADEIEKLVGRIHSTETARKNLLQELGHDLRTPLTSLMTTFDTLKTHFTRMSDADRIDCIDMISAEIKYFHELLEKLMTIATLDEPHYKKTTETIDINEMLFQEIKNRRGNSALQWTYAPAIKGPHALIIGDPHLILRMFKNALDNGQRYAKQTMNVALREKKGAYVIAIEDDGPGLTEEGLRLFGKRREHRLNRETKGLDFSLGLGSVIMKTIADLHEGQVEIANIESGGEVRGARLSIVLPRKV